jgi:hypothetical protein
VKAGMPGAAKAPADRHYSVLGCVDRTSVHSTSGRASAGAASTCYARHMTAGRPLLLNWSVPGAAPGGAWPKIQNAAPRAGDLSSKSARLGALRRHGKAGRGGCRPSWSAAADTGQAGQTGTGFRNGPMGRATIYSNPTITLSGDVGWFAQIRTSVSWPETSASRTVCTSMDSKAILREGVLSLP